MKKYLFLLITVLSVGTTYAFNLKADEPLTGYIGDAMCAGKGKANTADHAACAIKCIKGGSAAVLVVGDKVYKISNQDKVLKYAGKKVTVEGKVTDDSIEVASVADAK
jgi:hypothetical protein